MKYCANCGNQLSDEAKFCPKCGTTQEEQQQSYTQPNQSYIYQQPAGRTKFNVKPVFVVVAIGVIALIAILYKVFFSGGSRSMEGAVEKYYEAITDQDGEALLKSTCCGSLMEAIEEESGYSKEDMADAMEDSIEYSYEDYAKIKNIKIEDKDKMSKSELKEGLESIEDEIGVEVKISEIYELEVSFKYYDESYEECDEDTESLMVYKSGFGWYVLPDVF